MTKKLTERQQEARKQLVALCPPGTTVYTVLRHVARSGMSRRIDLYVIQDGEPRWLSGLYKAAEGITSRKYDAVTVQGCGMDMGFHLVYNLSHTLYPEGFTCTGDVCHSNDHSNGDRDHTPHAHRDGGYALKQRWM
jgi:hypothetical protein